MHDKVDISYSIETWLEPSYPEQPRFVSGTSVDKNTVLILRYSIEYLLNPFISDDFYDYLSKYCGMDDCTINDLSELLLALDHTLDLPTYIPSEYLPND